MKILELTKVEHSVKVGDTCGHIEPNVLDDSLFMVDGKPITNEYRTKIAGLAETGPKAAFVEQEGGERAILAGNLDA